MLYMFVCMMVRLCSVPSLTQFYMGARGRFSVAIYIFVSFASQEDMNFTIDIYANVSKI